MTATIGGNGTKVKKVEEGRKITIPAVRRGEIEVEIIGETPLIVHRFSDAEQAKIAGGQGHEPKVKKGPRKPREEFDAAMHRLPDGRHGFPAIGVKKSMILAGMRYNEAVGTVLYGALRIPGDLLVIESPNEPIMRTDRVVLQGKTSSLAYRPQYWPWRIVVPIRFIMNVVTADEVLNLLQWAGETVGLGDWRLDKKGDFGTWRVGEVLKLIEDD